MKKTYIVSGKSVKARAAESGLTLVEVLIASMIMTIAIIGLMTALFMSKQHAVTSDNRLDALDLARSHMERLFVNSYGVSALSPGTYTLPRFTNDNCVFRASYNVSTSSISGTKNIKVTVTWADPIKTNQHSVVLENTISSGVHP